MSVAGRIDAFQRRYPASGYPLAVAYKFFDDQGGYLAALIAYYGFISLFPLLLVFTSVLGFLLHDNPELQERIVDSALSQIPVVGSQLGGTNQLTGSTAAVTIGIVSAIYGGLGVAVAVQNAMNIAWTVPRNSRPNPVHVRIKGAVLLFTVGVAIIGLTVLNGFVAAVNLGADGRFLAIAGSIVLNAGVFLVAFLYGTARSVGVRDVLPGVIAAAVLWQGLQTFGAVYVQRVIARAGATYGVFAVVLGLLAFLYIAAVLIVICVECNVVRVDKLYPRSLLTPFTDNVVLTDGDKAAYSAAAKAQRHKGFERIAVTFHRQGDRPKAEPRDTEESPVVRPPDHRSG
ncbi:YihY/virulence factor BrkB family protein [Gordonia sp. CPCC 205515]|uniref:YihY/virulence factor BrkB family protein n=1 Tax=Gordonia sp. CPCC 205515 TaxID=3140791 RepID=UPI003AF3DEE5